MLKKNSKNIIFIIVLMMLLVFSAYLYKKNKLEGSLDIENFKFSSSHELTESEIKNEVIVQSDGQIQKVDISTNALSSATQFEQGKFTEFKGFPHLGIENNLNVEQTFVLVSNDKSASIVEVKSYAVSNQSEINESQNALETRYYICENENNSCNLTNILTQNYEGLDAVLQQSNSHLIWQKWDRAKDLIFGHILQDDGRDVSPVFVCETEKKICNKTSESNLAEKQTVVPQGAFSPLLDRFVMISQNDKPNIETGKNWNLLLYDSSDLSKAVRSYDISSLIDSDESVSYDSVYSVSWTNDEKRLAIGTSRRIFMFNLESGSSTLVYIAPADEDGDYYWDMSSLYLALDGKYITFIDSDTDFINENNDDIVEPINFLNKIDLAAKNKLSHMYSGRGLKLKLQ